MSEPHNSAHTQSDPPSPTSQHSSSLLAAVRPDLPHHGLMYPPGYLNSLPVILPRPSPHSPIRAITAAQLAQLRLAAATADVPDAVLFPYLHGLDGDNEAQNMFFTQQALLTRGPSASHSNSISVPAYRGLICVVAEDLEQDGGGEEHEWMDDDEDDMLDDSDDDMDEDDDVDEHEQGQDTESIPPDAQAVPSLDHSREASEDSSTTSGTSSPNTDSPPASVFGNHSRAASAAFYPEGAKTTPIHIPEAPRHTGPCPLLTSSFRPCELLTSPVTGPPQFINPKVPDGISLRNFGIQVGKYSTLCDIVIYSATGMTRSAFALAERFKHAIELKAVERHKKYPNAQLLPYNVFVVTDPFEVFEREYPHLVAIDCRGNLRNKIDFLAREKEEMRSLTRASEISDNVWLGNTSDAPMPMLARSADPFDAVGNPGSYDVCIECHDHVGFPTSSHLRQAEEHLRGLEERWTQQCAASNSPTTPGRARSTPPRSPRSPVSPTTSAILELSDLHFSRAKSSGPPTPLSLSDQASPALTDTPRTVRPRAEAAPKPRPAPNPMAAIHLLFPASPPSTQSTISHILPFLEFMQRMTSPDSTSSTSASRPSSSSSSKGGPFRPSRPLRVLIYSADGYTESSFLALAWLMYRQELSLPEAYLELQVEKHRSFFVYNTELGVLRRVESRLLEMRVLDEAGAHDGTANTYAKETGMVSAIPGASQGKRWRLPTVSSPFRGFNPMGTASAPPSMHLLSSSTPSTPIDGSTPSTPIGTVPKTLTRPRASTSPSLQLTLDHQAWFDDPRFDGSFPSRVLPFLYLGNLNHASNVYMLHALGITHVVSVGECALVPPVGHGEGGTGYNLVCPITHSLAGRGSLWMEEREGRIKVLDIKGVCDDGIDSLRPQIRPIVEWIEKARLEGGKVLVHCRVGVSRSATVTIAYVMKHMQCSLVEAYLMVRSRRLSVLIQPNMRLLYNLCGWEVELALDRIREGNAPETHGMESRLSWPYLAKEVHALNERYLS